jgi:plasmid stabilization system protein ParE
LYHGPTGRRSGTPFRVLFRILEAEDEGAEGTILILRVLHGAEAFPPPPEQPEDG